MTRTLRLALIAASGVLAIGGLAAAGGEPTPRQLMRFGVEAAHQGLWREAASRWERAIRGEVANPRLRNNLAVAYESLGRFEEAEREYREAQRLAPDSLEISDNHQSFLLMHPAFKGADDAAEPTPPAARP